MTWAAVANTGRSGLTIAGWLGGVLTIASAEASFVSVVMGLSAIVTGSLLGTLWFEHWSSAAEIDAELLDVWRRNDET